MKKKVLFIIGTKNQTTMMRKIADSLPEDYYFAFSTLYGDGVTKWATEKGLMNNVITGFPTQKQNRAYCKEHGLNYDYRGENENYDLVITCQDIEVPANWSNSKIIMVQEGTLTPVNLRSKIVKALGLKRGLADTSLTGLSHAYDYFCVASEGYKKEFIIRGADGDKIIVTGIPNFDNVQANIQEDFPYSGYVLVATSNLRESYNYENRNKFLKKAVKIANGKKLIFKLHPSENKERARREIKRLAPQESIIIEDGDINAMVANCDALVTHFSSVSLVAAALDKPVYGEYSKEYLQELKPVQNNGSSAKIIADLAVKLLEK